MKIRAAVATAVAGLTVAAVGTIAPAAGADPTWADADSAAIHPGTQTYTDGGQCTANFVFTDAADNVYIGQAAHCSGTGGQTETNGCDSGTLPTGTEVEVDCSDGEVRSGAVCELPMYDKEGLIPRGKADERPSPPAAKES